MHTVTEPLEFLDYGIKHRASDWHLCAGDEPSIRVNGDFQSCGSKEPITEELLRRLIIGAPNALQSIDLNHRDETFCYGTNTFRLTSFFSCGKLAATIRHIPQAVVPLQTLGVPQKFYDFLKLRSGLILISGPTGSGKSTTLTASLDHINSHESGMVLTLEDPIEFFHQPRKESLSVYNARRESAVPLATYRIARIVPIFSPASPGC